MGGEQCVLTLGSAFFRFTLRPDHSSVGRGNLVLTHSVHIKTLSFPAILAASHVEWRNSNVSHINHIYIYDDFFLTYSNLVFKLYIEYID